MIWLLEMQLHSVLEMGLKLAKIKSPSFAKLDGIILVKKITLKFDYHLECIKNV